jgi:metal-sulfur cluster biosynthetic enzyme
VAAENAIAANVTADSVTGENVSAGDVTADSVTGENVSAESVSAGDVSAGNVTAGNPGIGVAGEGAAKASVDDVNEAMKDVVDPELGINVVDLGLVYGVHVDDENIATLDMTLTSAACPLTDVIEEQTRAALTGGPGGGLVSDFRINWVWLPPWGPDKITDDGRDQLRSLGFNV